MTRTPVEPRVSSPRFRPFERGVLRSTIAGLAIALPLVAASGASAGEQPNILLIITDDAGWADFGFNDEGNGQIPTPAVDSIADRGRWFRAAYTAPVCSPSRARIFLGQHGQRTGYDHNGPDDQSSANAVVEGLTLSDTTMFERLKAAGYTVGYFGKWHLGTELDEVSGGQLVTPGNLPPRHGIDYFLGLTSGSRTYFTGQTSTYSQVLREQTLDPVSNLVVDVVREGDYPANTYLTDLLAEETADYITQYAGDASPFFAVLSFTAPHGPLQATQQYFDFVDQNIPGLTGNRRTYAAMMVAMDNGVGTVLDRLDDPNGDGDTSDSITDETLICFINDNGGETANSARNFPLRGKKSDTFDGGIRVVMTMAGPGVPATGASFDHPVDSSDLVPTFLAAAGSPLGPGDYTDGVNLLPYLDGSVQGPPHANIFVRGNNPLVTGLRKDQWKLTIENIGGPFLYDIEANRGETDVLNDQFPGIADELTDLTHGYETEYTKPRWGVTDVNSFDGFVYRPGAAGSGPWSAAGAWSNADGAPSVATMFGRDGYANFSAVFPTNESAYTATNTLTRTNLLQFMGNRLEFSGVYSGGADSGVVVDGLSIMLTDSLAGAPASVRMDATAVGAGAHPATLALDVFAWDDVRIEGAGDQTLLVTGSLLEERPGRRYIKSGGFPLEMRGAMSISGEFLHEGGSVAVLGAGSLSPAVVRVEDGASLRLASPADPTMPAAIGNSTELAVTTPAQPAPAPVALDFAGVEVIGALSIDGAVLPLGDYGAGTHPEIFSGTGSLRIRGPISCAGDRNDDGYADFFDVISFLRAFDAAEGCGGTGGPGLPGGITVNNEAWSDTPSDNTWGISPPGTDSSRVWTFGGNLSPEPVSDGPSALVSTAYGFPEAAASGADYEDPSRSPSSIEVWFRADSVSTEQIVWEAGGAARGAAITIGGGQVRLDVQNGGPAPVRAVAAISTGWHQVIAVIDITAGTSKLYVDGVLRDTRNLGATDRWSGGNPSGLGQITSSAVGNLTLAPFAGDIAIYRFYNNRVLSDAQALQAYEAVTLSASPCPGELDLNNNGSLDAGDIEAQVIRLLGCE